MFNEDLLSCRMSNMVFDAAQSVTHGLYVSNLVPFYELFSLVEFNEKEFFVLVFYDFLFLYQV